MLRPIPDPFEKLSMVPRTVGAEILKDVCEGRFGHGYLEEVVAEWDLFFCLLSISLQPSMVDSERAGFVCLPCYRLRHSRLGRTLGLR